MDIGVPRTCGVVPLAPAVAPGAKSFPRVCGVVPVDSRREIFSPRMRGCSIYRRTGRVYEFLSPRVRGCSLPPRQPPRSPILFPAYAGLFRPRPKPAPRRISFPRSCGVVPSLALGVSTSIHLSPRMRGCSDQTLGRRTGYAVLPAPAGLFPPRCLNSNHPSPFPRSCGVYLDHQLPPHNRGRDTYPAPKSAPPPLD